MTEPGRPPEGLRADAGSAVAEFVFITALLLILFLAALQLAVFLHARNLANDAAVHGARHAALADRTAEDGRRRADQLVAGSLGRAAVARVTALDEAAGPTEAAAAASRPTRVTVEVSVRIPLFGVFPGPLEYTAHAGATRWG